MLLERLYYERREAVEVLAEGFVRHHDGALPPVVDGRTSASEGANEGMSRLHMHLAGRLHRLEEGADLHNAVLVICADLLDRECRGASGLCPDTAASRFGADLATAVELLRGAGPSNSREQRRRSPVTDNELLRLVSLFAPERLGELLSAENGPPRLPLVEHIKARFGTLAPSIRALAGIQHLFGSTATLVEHLIGDTIAPADVHLLGKPYSTNHATMWHLRTRLGCQVLPGSFEYRGVREYHEEADEHARSLLHRVALRAATADLRVLLIDDGGRAIRMLHTPEFAEVSKRFVCVEQTRRGVRELHGVDPVVPIVNVAESRVKLTVESPIIADSVCTELLRQLDELGTAGIPRPANALVVGFGAIGAAVAEALRARGLAVGVHDADPSRCAAAGGRGFSTAACLGAALPAARLVVGCTGNASVGRSLHPFFADDAILASASSSDIEFEAWHLRSMARALAPRHRIVDEFNLTHERVGDRVVPLGDGDHPCHFLHVVRILGKRLYLLNGGFPVNFTGAVDPIAPERIQLTRALLYAGALQASRAERVGLLDLDERMQQEIEEQHDHRCKKPDLPLV
jgi:S-adenosylhomocysteine hydrolase